MQSYPYNIANQHSYEDEQQYDSRQTYRGDEIKNEYSTFIQQLEETTQKLMNEVFNTEYEGEIEDEHQLIYEHQQRLKKLSGKNIFAQEKESEINGQEYFKNFMRRNEKWKEMKDLHIKKQMKKKEQQEKRKMREIPQILRGSRQRMQPIYERALEIHSSKEKKIAFKKIDQKKREEEEFKKHTFHPQINQNMKIKTRTLQEYLKDKSQWEKKKKDSRQFRKLQEEAKKYTECHFTPQLVSKPIPNNSRIRPGQPVEDRLLRSLQKFIQEEE